MLCYLVLHLSYRKFGYRVVSRKVKEYPDKGKGLVTQDATRFLEHSKEALKPRQIRAESSIASARMSCFLPAPARFHQCVILGEALHRKKYMIYMAELDASLKGKYIPCTMTR